MRGLPQHYVPRPRLIDLCAGQRVVVIEASGGYGKTVLATELVRAWGAISIDIQLDRGGVTAPLFAARMRAAMVRAGFTGASWAAADAGEDPVAAVDAIVFALSKERCAIVVDDAHEASTDAAALIDRVAQNLGDDCRLVVLARHLPEGAERLRRADFLHLTSADLSLNLDECGRLCNEGFGLNFDLDAIRALHQATGGWTAATALAAAKLARTGEAVGSVLEAASDRHPTSSAVGVILDEAVVALGPDHRSALAQVARLPLLDRQVVDLVDGSEGFFDRALEVGVPFAPSREPWWDLPGPVRDHLATLAGPDREVLVCVAREYERRGETGQALQLLLGSGQASAAAQLLVDTPGEVLEAMDVFELEAVFEQLPPHVVDSHPQVLLIMARALRVATRDAQCTEMLARARSLAEGAGNDELLRAVDIEAVHMKLRLLQTAEVAVDARRILAAAGENERLTRARAYQALAQALCARVDELGRRDSESLQEAERCFSKASTIYRSLGLRSAAAALAPYWAISLDLARGRAADALRRLDEALELAANRPRRRGYVLCFKTWVAAELGQDELCRASADELFRIAKELDSDLFFAHGHWKLAHLSSYRGDAEATLDHLRQAELHKGQWWVPASGDFLAEAADMLDRVDLTALALQYLARVKAEPKDAGHMVALAEAAIEARHGDPVLADELLTAAGNTRIDPRDYWRLKLLKAYAAFRRGEDRVAGAMAAEAFEDAARLGQADLPLIRERSVTEQLLGLAVLTGQPAAIALNAAVLPTCLSLLGRFELTKGGRRMDLGAGQEAQLLKLVAVNGGRVHSEVAIEAMWPEVAAEAGRNRLRTVLNRLRTAAGDIVGRQGEMLILDPSVRVDVSDLRTEADRAMTLAASDHAVGAAIARGAITRYRGDLLPDDPYASWADAARSRTRGAVLELLNLCASDAAARGDLDGLRRIVQQAIEIDPYDDNLYHRAAKALLDQGRRGEALAVVQRARTAFADIGLPPPSSLADLETHLSSDRQSAGT